MAPAVSLRECMEVRGYSAADMAQRGVSQEVLARALIAQPLSPEECRTLGRALGTTEEFWVRLERYYREGLAAGKTDVSHFPCPHCHRELELRDGVFPYHDFPPGCRALCPMSKKSPT